MKCSLPKLASGALAAALFLTQSNSFANGTPYVMSTGDYLEQFGDVANWTDGFAAGIGAAPWNGVPTQTATGTIPDGSRISTATTTFQGTTTSGGVQKPGVGSNPAGAITLLTTGSTDNTSADAIDLFLDFSGRFAGTLSFTWASVTNSTGDRRGSLRVYTSTDGATWTELAGAAVLNFQNNNLTSGSVTAVSLPSSFNGSATARIRFYEFNGTGGTTGSRPKIALDNVAVTSTGSPIPPNVTGISPSSISTNAGSSATFTVTATGSSPLYYFWYKETGSSTDLVAGATTSALTFPSALGTDAASYQAVVSNTTTLTSTSAVVSLTVDNDPRILVQPASVNGFLDGTAQFSVSVAASSPGYQWYFADASSNITAKVSNGAQTSGSTASGATSSSFSLNNLQYGDQTNFVVVVSNQFGSVTSVVASVLSVTNHGVIAYWDFNGPEFTNSASSISNPAPYIGSGTAFAFGTANVPGVTPFSGSVDPIDGIGFAVNNHLPNFSWGTSTYPTNGNPANNKTAGIEFKTSTVGAKNITVTYDSRPSATASVYERLQYTIDGTTWVDYPASTTFGIGHGTTYSPFAYNLSGFPGVANNPNFAVRIVTEMENTASYGIIANTNYVGANNTYGQTGTLTYDIVTISGDAITNANIAPTVTTSPDTNTPENVPLTLNFTVGDADDGAANVTLSAQSLNPSKVNPSFAFSGSGASRTLQITPNGIPDTFDAAPILVTATDPHGDVGVSWFLLTVSAVNLPPTNSLTSLKSTNTIAGTPITIPFTVGDDHTAGSITVSGSSDNQTLVSNANVVPSGSGANRIVTITPNAGQLGIADIYVSVSDNDPTFPKTTTATIALTVRPNTNVVLVDHFSYDNSGALDTVSSNTWKHLSGPFAQMQLNSGVVTVDTFDNTENLQAALLGAPYTTNSAAVLYSSFIINMADTTKLPLAAGTYFAIFNDGSGNTANVEGRVMTGTNGAAPGLYRVGIANLGSVATNAAMFPQDLLPTTNYVVVMKLVVSNGFSTIWVNPVNGESSPSVSDTTVVPPGSLFNMSQFELRESGANGGSINVSKVRVGKTFDSVFPSPQIQTIGGQTVVTWSDPTVTLQSATAVLGPYTDLIGVTSPYTNSSPSATVFYRFKP
jgi:hypothetical protein